MATKSYLFDTNVLIEHLRKANPLASQWIDKAARKNITAGLCKISIIELWVGVKTPSQDQQSRFLIAPFQKFDFNQRIARRTAELWRPFHKDPHITVADYLIAATAEYYQADIVTTNVKHFDRLPLKNVSIIDAHKQ